MKEIPLTKGKTAFVTDEDYDWLMQWRWQASENQHKGTPSNWYAARMSGRPNRKKYFMHREIALRMGFPSEKDCEHKDNNGLNNQRENLRPCNQSQNNANRIKELGCSSKYKGVTWRKNRNKWISCLRLNGKCVHKKLHANEVDAAKAYDAAAKIYFGEFARLNFPS